MTGEQPETIPVRPDERFDVSRLMDWLDGRLPGSDVSPDVSQFSRGKANLTYLLDFGGGNEFVLRRPPLGPVAPGSHDMAREHRVLSTLWRAFPLAPRSYVFCDDADVVGAPFFIMERRHGIVVQNTVPDVFGGGNDPVANRKLSEVVVDTLADFHAVDPGEAGLADLGRPEGFLERQVMGWARRWDAAKHEDNPLAEELAGWLVDTMPTSPPPTLLHNDWRLDNMAVAVNDPGTCVAVYDWDMCTQGDPLADLGTVMAVWYDAGEMPSALNPMPTTRPGFMSRDAAISRYVERSGIEVTDVDWYVVFGTFKLAAVLQQIFIRWHRGQTGDDRFARYGEGAARLIQLADERRRR
jgi:aminoglycoside phosphotransferase (APT) family kinase protein